MLDIMSSTQLAIRFTDQQIRALDSLVGSSGSTRSAVIKQLVDDAERKRVEALYAVAYESGDDTDSFGDLDDFHDAMAADRRAARTTESSW